MAQRLIIGLHPDADWGAIRQQLVTCGAEWIRDPSPEQPDVAVATVPDQSDVDRVLADIKQVTGVRYAERDAMSWTS
jgi:fervidolysin-like protein